MKKMMFLACLIIGVTAITATAATVEEMREAKADDMVAQLTNADPAGWCDYMNTALESGDDALIKKVIVNAQKALNQLDDEAARNVATALNDKVKDVVIARDLYAKYILAYVGSVNSTGNGVNLKSIIDTGDGNGDGLDSIIDGDSRNLKTNKIGKGVGAVSAPAARD